MGCEKCGLVANPKYSLRKAVISAMEALNLNLPTGLAAPEEFGLESNPDSVRDWLSKLPLTNAAESSQQIIQLLKELNKVDLEIVSRYRYLNLLLPVTGKLTEMLRVGYQNAFLPLSKKNLNKFILAIDMANELERGYRIIVNQITCSEHFKTDKKQKQLLITCLYLTIEQLATIMHEHYVTYFPIPKHIWQLINKLYQFAEQHQLEQLTVPNSEQKHPPLSISYIYRVVMLLSIVNPHHLMHGEITKIKKHICEAAKNCQLKNVQDINLESEAYVIDLNLDQSPRFVSNIKSLSGETYRALDIHPFLMRVKGKLRDIQKEEPQKSNQAVSLSLKLVEEDDKPIQKRKELDLLHRIFRDMYSRIITTLDRNNERTHERNQSLGELEMTIGLSSSHFHLSAEEDFSPELDEIRLHTGKQGSSLSSMSLIPLEFEHWRSDESEHRITDGVQKPRTSNFDSESDALDTWNNIYSHVSSSPEHQQLIASLREYQTSSTWKQRNISAGGMCVFCLPCQPIGIRVGELVSYRSSDSEAWWIGLVRWLRIHDNSMIEIGLMHLHHQAYHVAVRAIKGTGSGSEYFRSILTEEDIDDQFNTIILPTAIFDQNTELVVNFSDKLVYLKLHESVLTTKSISQFRYELIDTPEIETESIIRLKRLI